jgi:beta-lactamase regulating signal transducer with metallopeptidase domain
MICRTRPYRHPLTPPVFRRPADPFREEPPMTWVVETALVNAVLASGLALLALAASRWSRRPALVHALWVLVLIKLVTPAVWELPVPVSLVRAAHESDSALASGLKLFVREVPAEPAVLSPPLAVSHATSLPAVTAAPPPAGKSHRPTADASVAAPMTAAVPDPTPVPAAARYSAWQIATFAALFAWLAGSLAWLWVNGVQMRRFHRCLREAQPVDDDLAARGRELAAQMGIKSCPRIVLLDAPVSPLLWGCGRRTSIVLPAELFEQLGESERDALLVHELAHFRRGDHWVRVLEMVVLCVYWWHPVVWLARRGIADTEEECCDGWVVCRSSVSPRHYAAAILTTLDLLSEQAGAVPTAATGACGMPLLERRFRQIMHRQSPPPLSPVLRSLVLGLACLLPLQPRAEKSAVNTMAPFERSGELRTQTPEVATPDRTSALR